ncbi:type II toxin-antitoxin system RelE/ParE family toxin [Ottowia sp.]|uniref:type II toxin-antitoxin system RelE/ParE family toxin n=1 Tax=Ottowia sp. TaxID=1898956 RepID=UPI0039E56C56
MRYIETDLEEIWLYTLKRWSMEQADGYLRKLVAAFEGLAAGTRQGSPSVLPCRNLHPTPINTFPRYTSMMVSL